MIQKTGPIPVPDVVQDFAGQLSILESVPANYFLPHDDMLPKESIRFFYVDKNWTNALLDGMYSLGRFSELDQAQDTEYFQSLQTAAWEWVKSSRPDAEKASSPEPITGFILHSTVVADYPSMQVHAYSGGSATAPEGTVYLIRLAHLTPDTLIGLFSGEFKYLALSKPPEMLHFGFELETQPPPGMVNTYTDPSLYVYLRSLATATIGKETGTCIGWGTDSNRRVQISSLAACLKKHTSATNFKSDEFAVEMIHGAETVVFQNNTGSKHP